MLSVVCKYVSLLRNLSKEKWFFAFFIKKISMKWDVLQSLHISHKKVYRELDFGSNFELFESRLNQHCILMTKNFFRNRTTFTCKINFSIDWTNQRRKTCRETKSKLLDVQICQSMFKNRSEINRDCGYSWEHSRTPLIVQQNKNPDFNDDIQKFISQL